jgi:hypothetical protein
VNRRFSAPSDPPKMRHQAGSMIADAVRYMSVHSWNQPRQSSGGTREQGIVASGSDFVAGSQPPMCSR